MVNSEKLLKAYNDLDLDLMMLNIKLVRAILIYYKVLKFHVPRWIFLVILKNTHTHTDSGEYSIVAFSKNTTIIIVILNVC